MNENVLKTTKTDTRMRVNVVVPGFKLSEIKVRAKVVDDDNVIVIKGRPKDKNKVLGLVKNSFTEKVIVPADFDVEELSASLRKGILSIDIPRTAESLGKEIDVSTKLPEAPAEE